MIKQLLIIIAVFGFLGTQSNLEGKEWKTNSAKAKPFETVEVYFEQNSTDGDAEVVFKATAGDMGLVKLLVVAPNGHTVIDFELPDQSTMGIRSFHMESPEPEDIDAVKKAYPSGVYKFSGTTIDEKEYQSEATLSHTLATPVTITNPSNDAKDVSTADLEITWTPVKGVKAYLVEVEQEDADVKVEATLPGSQTSFSVPQKFLLPDAEYKVVIGTMAEDGNLNFVEIAFSTAEK